MRDLRAHSATRRGLCFLEVDEEQVLRRYQAVPCARRAAQGSRGGDDMSADEIRVRLGSEHLDAILAAYRVVYAIDQMIGRASPYRQTLDDLEEFIGRARDQ